MRDTFNRDLEALTTGEFNRISERYKDFVHVAGRKVTANKSDYRYDIEDAKRWTAGKIMLGGE